MHNVFGKKPHTVLRNSRARPIADGAALNARRSRFAAAALALSRARVRRVVVVCGKINSRVNRSIGYVCVELPAGGGGGPAICRTTVGARPPCRERAADRIRGETARAAASRGKIARPRL